MSLYAEGTSVSVEKSRAEIEGTLARYGATAFMYATGQDNKSGEDKAMLQFQAGGRRIMFVLNLPDRANKNFTHGYAGKRRKLPDADAYKKWEQACRQKWRCLALAIKAKLEAVESGISAFEDEFMAHIVMPDGKTVSHHMRPQIETAYLSGKMPLMLGWVGK